MRPSRILIVEDDRIVARDLQDHVTRIGHTVVGLAARGEDALPLAIQSQPDLVLMDIRLEGEIDGIDAAQQIRDCCRIPVVYLTAYADDQTLQRARVTEPFGYLLKPFEDSQLRTTIEMALYKHAADRRLRESERRYAVTLSSIGDAVIATDESLKVTFMNPVAETLTGWSLRDAAGLPLEDVFRIINEDSRQPVENPAVKVLRSGIIVGLANHSILVARDGRERPIDDCGSPIIDDHGAITGAVLVFRDITQRRQIDSALRRAQAEQIQARFEERERIARELHDTLLQNFQGVLLRFQGGVNLLPGGPDLSRARDRLQGAVDQAQQAINDCRDAIQGLRSSTIETNDLAAALNTLAAELAANRGGPNPPVFEVHVEGTSREIHPILRDNVFRIAAEALRNAFLYAEAGRIEVEIHCDERQLRLRIRDDGGGIDSQILADKGREGHWGLRGMHERAKLVGGNLEVWSTLDCGTEIELTIPASIAYAKPTTRRRSWFARKGTAVKLPGES
jgi:PAS domain S-box-containing protein